MAKYLSCGPREDLGTDGVQLRIQIEAERQTGKPLPGLPWPLPNVWLGVTAGTQATADERIPHLLATPAAVRFSSCEPLLGPVELWSARYRNPIGGLTGAVTGWSGGVDWVICGGESGPGARPMSPNWARSLRDQCQAAAVPFFFKQWGEWAPMETEKLGGDLTAFVRAGNGKVVSVDGAMMERVGKKAAGRMLEGRECSQFPEARR
jgi:protein gp37